ncbi:hypothetical protein GGI18_000205, partial [Coemansia linderi]
MAGEDPPKDGDSGIPPDVAPTNAGPPRTGQQNEKQLSAGATSAGATSTGASSAEEILNGQEEQPEQMDTLEEPVRVCIEQLSAYYNDDDLMAQVVHLLETGEKAKEAGRLKLVALDAQRNAAEIEAKSLQVDAKIAEKIEELKTLRGEKADLARQGRAGNIQLAESVKAWEIAVTAANGGSHLPSTAEMELRKTRQTLEQTQKELSQLKLARALGGPQGLARPGNKAPASMTWAQRVAQGIDQNSSLALKAGPGRGQAHRKESGSPEKITLTTTELAEAREMKLPDWADPEVSGHWLMIRHPNGVIKSEATFQSLINDWTPKNSTCFYYQRSAKAGIVLVRSATWGQAVVRLRRAGMTPLPKVAPWELAPGESSQSAALTKMTKACMGIIKSGSTGFDASAAEWLLLKIADADGIALPLQRVVLNTAGQGEPGQTGTMVNLPGAQPQTSDGSGLAPMDTDKSR